MRAVILMLLVGVLPAVAGAQPPSPLAASAGQGTPSPEQPPAGASAPPPPPENYAYQPDGRRDPFLSLLGAGTETRAGLRAPGPGGIAVDELSVRGILQSRGALIAMIQGPDNRTYIVHSGDKLLDGVIKTVTLQGLVIVQEVNDPLSLVKQREVTKRMRSQEDAKQ